VRYARLCPATSRARSRCVGPSGGVGGNGKANAVRIPASLVVVAAAEVAANSRSTRASRVAAASGRQQVATSAGRTRPDSMWRLALRE